MIILWQFEECENSQPVRALLTELGVDYVAVNAPQGMPHKDAVMNKLFGNAKTPAMWDTHSGALLQGTEACSDYLRSRCRRAA